MLANVKLTHKVFILPVAAAVGFALILGIVSTGSARARAVREGLTDRELRQAPAAVDAGLLTRIDAELMRADRIDRAAINTAAGVSAAMLAIFGIASIAVQRHISSVLERILLALGRVTDGDLTHRFNPARVDEIGRAGEALDHLFAIFEGTVYAFAGNTTVLAESAENLSSLSHGMSSTAEETSSQAALVSASARQVDESIHSVAAAVEQLTVSVQEIASNAHQAARIASDAVRVTDDTSTTIRSLGSSSAEIGQVVKVINSIAEQTNLLALNATIEAARAGEAGRGFAVVANEVKELARETARATEDIERRVATIQHDTQKAIDAVSQVGSIVHTINQIQTSIATAVEEQTATTSEIGRSVSEAALGSSEISRRVDGVAEAARSTSDGAAATLEAALQLDNTATDLEATLSHFRSSREKRA